MYLVGHAQCWLLAYHRSDRRLTIGPKQEDENGNGNKERQRERGGGRPIYKVCDGKREKERKRARAREEDAVNDTMGDGEKDIDRKIEGKIGGVSKLGVGLVLCRLAREKKR